MGAGVKVVDACMRDNSRGVSGMSEDTGAPFKCNVIH